MKTPIDPSDVVEVPDEFRNDPVLSWADSLTAGNELRTEKSYEFFLQLLEKYAGLLRRFSKVLRISDSYQREIKEMNVQLNEVARTDYLTGLSNRRDMFEKTSAELSRVRRHGDSFSLLLADIDSFKAFNDTYGHEAGDEVIRAVARSLKSNLRMEDLCSRWGGEEFLIGLPSVDADRAQQAAEKLRIGVESLVIEYRGERLRATVSVGVARYVPGIDIDALVRHADQAMLQAKRAGKNRVTVDV
ncbi:MAG TPA: diguanylate cyclase [Spirochaetia bacterium]|nr:diguanylate cyclase [Spirochaetia bacterium]